MTLPLFSGAICTQVDTELFFPAKGSPARDALAICNRCPVIEPCREYAIQNPVVGIWGGTRQSQRRDLAAARGLAYNTDTCATVDSDYARPPLPESLRKRELRDSGRMNARQAGSPRIREAHRLRALGISLELIAQQMGVSERTVGRYLRISLPAETEQVAS